MRKTRCIRPEAFRRALELERVWVKSEDLPPKSFLRYYVDLGQLRKLDNNSNHLISGRRGTGKTHLLGAFEEYIQNKNSNEIALKISILDLSAQELKIPSGLDGGLASYITARDLFNQMLKLFFDRFLTCINPIKLLLDRERQRTVDNLLQELLTEVEVGTYFASSGRESKPRADNNSVKVATPVFGGDPGDQRSTAPVGTVVIERGEQKGFADHDNFIEHRGSIDHQNVRVLVSRVLAECDISVLHLLIDEWMELDKNTPSRIQNYFAQFLKKVFFNERSISVVIASIWNQTSLYERENMEVSTGIQIGHDIERTVDLDTSFFDSEEQIVEFCKEMLFVRLSTKEPVINDFRDSNGSISDAFITDIFDNPDNFKVFVAASHGIPRDLMKIFKTAAHMIDNNFEKSCIDYALINSVSQNIYRQEKRETVSPSSYTKIMWTKINDYMYRTGRRVFVVEDGSQKTSRAFRALIDHELIHEIPNVTLPRWLRHAYRAYFIDYGNYVDWRKSKSKSITELLTDSVLPNWDDISQEAVSEILIEIVPDRDLFVECQQCHYFTPVNHNVYVKNKICLNCGERFEVH